VIVVAARVARDLATARCRDPGPSRVVDEADGDDALDALEDPARVDTLLETARDPPHLAREAPLHPLAQELGLSRRARPGDPREVETHGERETLDTRFQAHAVLGYHGRP
jgi:hypothetical protein